MTHLSSGDDEEYVPTDEEAAEIDAAIAEADLGGGVPADEVLRELRARR